MSYFDHETVAYADPYLVAKAADVMDLDDPEHRAARDRLAELIKSREAASRPSKLDRERLMLPFDLVPGVVITHVVAASGKLAIATSDMQLHYYDTLDVIPYSAVALTGGGASRSAAARSHAPGHGGAGDALHRLFMDPLGRHILAVLRSGITYHLFVKEGQKMARHVVELGATSTSATEALEALQTGNPLAGVTKIATGMTNALGAAMRLGGGGGGGGTGGAQAVIDSVAWDVNNSFENATGTVVLGTRTGQLWTARFEANGIVGDKKVLNVLSLSGVASSTSGGILPSDEDSAAAGGFPAAAGGPTHQMISGVLMAVVAVNVAHLHEAAEGSRAAGSGSDDDDDDGEADSKKQFKGHGSASTTGARIPRIGAASASTYQLVTTRAAGTSASSTGGKATSAAAQEEKHLVIICAVGEHLCVFRGPGTPDEVLSTYAVVDGPANVRASGNRGGGNAATTGSQRQPLLLALPPPHHVNHGHGAESAPGSFTSQLRGNAAASPAVTTPIGAAAAPAGGGCIGSHLATISPSVSGTLSFVAAQQHGFTRATAKLWLSFSWTSARGVCFGQINEDSGVATLTTWVPVDGFAPSLQAASGADAAVAGGAASLMTPAPIMQGRGAQITGRLANSVPSSPSNLSARNAAASIPPGAAVAAASAANVKIMRGDSNGFFTGLVSDEQLVVVAHMPGLPWPARVGAATSTGGLNSASSLSLSSFGSLAGGSGGIQAGGGRPLNGSMTSVTSSNEGNNSGDVITWDDLVRRQDGLRHDSGIVPHSLASAPSRRSASAAAIRNSLRGTVDLGVVGAYGPHSLRSYRHGGLSRVSLLASLNHLVAPLTIVAPREVANRAVLEVSLASMKEAIRKGGCCGVFGDNTQGRLFLVLPNQIFEVTQRPPRRHIVTFLLDRAASLLPVVSASLWAVRSSASSSSAQAAQQQQQLLTKGGAAAKGAPPSSVQAQQQSTLSGVSHSLLSSVAYDGQMRLRQLFDAARLAAGKKDTFLDTVARAELQFYIATGRSIEAAVHMATSAFISVDEAVLVLRDMQAAREAAEGQGVLLIEEEETPLIRAPGDGGGGGGGGDTGGSSAPTTTTTTGDHYEDAVKGGGNNSGSGSSTTTTAPWPSYQTLRPLILFVLLRIEYYKIRRQRATDNAIQLSVLCNWLVLLLLQACNRSATAGLASGSEATTLAPPAGTADLAGGGATSTTVNNSSTRRKRATTWMLGAVTDPQRRGTATDAITAAAASQHNTHHAAPSSPARGGTSAASSTSSSLATLITADELAKLKQRAEEEAARDAARAEAQLFAAPTDREEAVNGWVTALKREAAVVRQEVLSATNPIGLLSKHLVLRAPHIDMPSLRSRISAMADPATSVLVSTIGGAFEEVIRLLLSHHQAQRAAHVLATYCHYPEFASLWYRYAAPLMRYAPMAFVRRGLIPHHNDVRLQPILLMPALLAYNVACNESGGGLGAAAAMGNSNSNTSMALPTRPPNISMARRMSRICGTAPNTAASHQYHDNVVIEYLLFLVHKTDNADAPIHHLLLQQLITEQCDDDIIALVKSSHWLNPAYAFRVCAAARRFKCCVDLLLALEMPVPAIQLALTIGDTQLAKDRLQKMGQEIVASVGRAGKPGAPAAGASSSRKSGNSRGTSGDATSERELLLSKLWRMVARSVLAREGGAKNSLLLLTESTAPFLSVSHLLPNFSRQVMLCEFKHELLQGVAGFADRMQQSHRDVKELQALIGDVRTDVIAARATVAHNMSASKRCAQCHQLVVAGNRTFTYFPTCGHAYHRSCEVKFRKSLVADGAPADTTVVGHSECPMCSVGSLKSLLTAPLTGWDSPRGA